ncbi:MAG: hypothetical protein LBI04_06800 [Treponema sp.]|nr:hypothetical protein [Treponema sp.]
MTFLKRALALWLGLFFYFFTPLDAQETSAPVSGNVHAGTGTLWVDDDGTSFYWHSGLAVTLIPGGPSPHFFMNFDLGEVSSSLPLANGSVFGFMGQLGVKTSDTETPAYTPFEGLTLAFGFFNQPQISVVTDEFSISNDGGNGYFFGIEAPLRFGCFSVVPVFMYGTARWQDGDLYWFFGKPQIPCVWGYGLDISLSTESRYAHSLGFRGLAVDLNIISNEDEPLFAAGIDALTLFYQFSLENEKTAFSGTLGWLYAGLSLDGALTSSNQPYFLFPYLYFNITDACYKAHAGFALLRFRYNHGIFRYNFNLGALNIFYDHGEADIQYKNKKLFGGNEHTEKFNIEISGLGAAFLSLSAALPSLPIGSRCRLSLGLQKMFFLPWGYQNLLSSGASTSGSGTETPSVSSSILKTVLLSGLSFSGSLSW